MTTQISFKVRGRNQREELADAFTTANDIPRGVLAQLAFRYSCKVENISDVEIINR